MFDPRIEYDPYAKRWIAVAILDRVAASSAVAVAVSETSDPTGNWWGYKFSTSSTGLWADYPIVGFNKNWIVVQEQLFPETGSQASQHSRIIALSKADLYSGQSASFTIFDLENGDGLWQAPADTYDPNLGDMFFVQNYGASQGYGWVQVYRLSGPVGEPVLFKDQWARVTSTWANNSTAQNPAPQLGTTEGINNGDARLQDLEYRNGSLWATHQVFVGSPTRTSVQWWQIDPQPTDQQYATVKQFGRIDDASSQHQYAYPSIAVNKDNDVLIGYSSFSSTQYASASYSYRAGTDAPSTVSPPTLLKAGEGPYYGADSYGRNRWGDYSATVVDPVNDSDLWTLQEYALPAGSGANYGRWATWWGRISPSQGAPPNDNFGNAQQLSGINTTRDGDTNVGATKEQGESDHAGNQGGASIWYRWTAPTDGEVTIDTLGSDFDTLLAAYTGGSVSGLSEVASNDDIVPVDEQQSRVNFQVTANTTYRIAIDGFDNDDGAGADTGMASLHLVLQASDTDPPETTITSGPSGTTTNASPSFGFTSDEANSSFQCRLDGAAFASCSSPRAYSNLADGAHTFEVRATDQANNTDPTPASRSFAVDTTAPQTTITSGPADGATINTDSVSFGFSSSETGSTFQCRLEPSLPAWDSCTSPTGYTLGTSDAARVFAVRAIDSSGNVDPTPASRSFTVDRTSDTTVDGTVYAKRKQKQKGKKIVVDATVCATGAEIISVEASGRVKIGRTSYGLKPTKASVAPDRCRGLKLAAGRRGAKAIHRALNHGRGAKARLRLELDDWLGNTEVEKLVVNLRTS